MSKIIAVVGATGAQGGSVARTFLQTPGWIVRGITRNPEGEAAQALAAEGVSIIQGDLDDKESLIRAFKGAHVIFSNTDFFTHAIHGLNPGNLPEGRTTLEYAYDREVAQGFNIAAAAAAPSVIETLERFVMSTLSNATKRSNGKYTGVYHFDTKSEIIRLIQERCPTVASRLSTVTVGHYATIWKFTPALAPQLQPDGSYLLARNSPADFKWPLVVTHQDTGGFVKALVDLPSNKHIFAVSQYMTFPEFMKTWGSVHGVKAEYTRISREEMFQSLPESLGTEMGDSFDFIHEFGYTARDPSVLSAEELNVKVPVTSIEEYIKSEDWSSIIKSDE